MRSTPLTRVAQPSSDESTPASSQVPLTDLVDDQKKRKRRSLSPVPSTADMSRKKARMSDATEDLEKEQTALAEMQANTETSKEIRGEVLDTHQDMIIDEPNQGDDATVVGTEKPTQTRPMDEVAMRKESPHSAPRSPSPVIERDVPPAIHPATSSIYIRNFKRPLHIPTLRTHIVTLAKSRSSKDDSDPIKVFYLDSIRTHAFISFTSIAAASRVRIAMHGTPFPDEALREPLFVDYIPDDKVQSWIDEETGGNSFGGRAGGRRFEVIYEEGEDGTEAIFQEVGSRRDQPATTSKPSIDRPKAELDLPPGVHPDRASLVPSDQHHQTHPTPPTGPGSTSGGIGFQALDELFSYTTAKPKLYYKPVSNALAQDRLDMMRELRVGHEDRGRSGDGGMKRYTFQWDRDGEEWVDKGPEFGYGKLGQERLVGVRGRGGFGYRGGRGGDSWRRGR
jgi:hypothetical protein